MGNYVSTVYVMRCVKYYYYESTCIKYVDTFLRTESVKLLHGYFSFGYLRCPMAHMFSVVAMYFLPTSYILEPHNYCCVAGISLYTEFRSI